MARPAGADRVFWPLLAGLLLLALGPLFAVDLLPFQDLHLHQALAEVLHGLRSDPGHPWAQTYQLAPPLVRPNALYPWACHALAPWLGVAGASRALVALALVGLPLSLLALYRALGRSRWRVFATLPLVYNAHVALGFVSFQLGTPLLFGGLALAAGLLTRPHPARAGALAAVTLLAFFAHAQVFLLLLGLEALLAALLPTTRRARAWLAATTLPALAALLPWYWRLFVAETPTAAGVRFFGLDRAFGAVWSPLPEWLADWPRYVNGLFAGPADALVLGALALLLLAPLPWSARPRAPWRGARAWAGAHALEVLTLALALAATLPPSHIANQFVVRERQMLLAVLLLPGFAPWPRARAWRGALVGVTALGSALWFGVVGQRFRAWERAQAPLVQVIDALPRGARVARVQGDRRDPLMTFGASWYLHALAVSRREAVMPLWFAGYPGTPVQYRAGAVLRDPGPDWATSPDARAFDYLLVRTPPGATPTLPAGFREYARAGEWRALRVEPPPAPGRDPPAGS